MKKKVVVFLTICFMFAFVQQYFKRNSELADFVNSTLANIESLAQDEIGSDGCWLQPERNVVHFNWEAVGLQVV